MPCSKADLISNQGQSIPFQLTTPLRRQNLAKLLTSVLDNDILCLQTKLGKEAIIMERNEILKKAQAERVDERELQVKDKSMMWSYITMVFMAAIFSFIRSEQGLPMMDLSATVSASVFAGMTYRFIKTKKKENAIIALVMLSVVVIATISFFMGH